MDSQKPDIVPATGESTQEFVREAERYVCPSCGAGSVSQAGRRDIFFCGECLLDFALRPGDPSPPDEVGDQSLADDRITLTLGSYLLTEEIGRGGMGVIYRAIHRETREVVALKTLLPEDAYSPEPLERFRREALAAQMLDHPNAMPIREVGQSVDGVPFFTMNLAAGGSLQRTGAKFRGRWRQIAELVIKVSAAVHHAHLRGILHRDLKPGNILFTEDYEPLVSDFGSAKHLIDSKDLTQTCTILGTPNYVSPEQATGKTKDLTAATDIYSLGVILFELLTGRPPFVGSNPLEVLQQVASQLPKRPRSLEPGIPRTLETICMRCLERRPEDRYETAQGLAADLEEWLQGRKILSRPRYARLWRAIYSSRPGWKWWYTIASLGAVTFLIWIMVGGPKTSAIGIATIAVAIDDLNQNPFLNRLARQATDELKRSVSKDAMFRLTDGDVMSPLPSEGVFDPLAYGRAHNAQIVLTGCVRRSGDEVRLVTRLVRCDTEEVLWRGVECITVERAFSNLPHVAGRVLSEIESGSRANPHFFTSQSSYSPLPDAQSYFTKAKELAARTNREDLRESVKYFRRAADTDPHFTAARAMLGFALWAQADRYGELENLPVAVSAAREALAIDPGCAQAHRVIASCYFKAAQYDKAIEEFWSALELNPQSCGNCQSLGMCLREMGHPQQAIPWLTRAVQLDRARGVLSGSLGESLALCGYDHDAETNLKHAIALDGNQPDVQIVMCALRTWQKEYGEARRLCAQVRLRFPDSRFGLSLAAWIELCDGNDLDAKRYFEELRLANSYQKTWDFYGAINPSSALAFLAKKSGEMDRARSLAQEAITIDNELLQKFPGNARILHDMAATRCLLGATQPSLILLEKSRAAGWAERRSSLIDPRFVNIVDTPRFAKTLASTLPDIN